MTWKVLISSSHLQSRLGSYLDLLKENNIEFDTITRPQFVPEADLLPIVGEYDAIVCSDDEITDKVLEKAKKLKLISKWGVGINSIDLESAKRRGIEVYNSPGAFSESCAVMAFSYILHFARHVKDQDKSIRNNNWEHVPGMALKDKTLGIIGFGNVGKAVAKRALAFDMKVLVNDIREINNEELSSGIAATTKEEVLKNSDFVILAPSLNPTSLKLISEKELSLMRPNSYLINVSRGPVVDEKALVEALKDKRISGAGLDVFEVEPLPQSSPLREMDNVILTPHNAYNTTEAENYVHDNTVRNLVEGLRKLKAE